jgi:hypothetical protein
VSDGAGSAGESVDRERERGVEPVAFNFVFLAGRAAGFAAAVFAVLSASAAPVFF